MPLSVSKPQLGEMDPEHPTQRDYPESLKCYLQTHCLWSWSFKIFLGRAWRMPLDLECVVTGPHSHWASFSLPPTGVKRGKPLAKTF